MKALKFFLWFFLGYYLVTKIGRTPSTFSILAGGEDTDKELDTLDLCERVYKRVSDAYMRKMKCFPLSGIIIFSILAYLYFSRQEIVTLEYALSTGGIWTGLCLLLDTLGYLFTWLFTRTNYMKELNFKGKLYLFLGYLSLFLGVVLGFLFVRI